VHPAKSVIFFTTASGAGYGLLFWLGVFAAFAGLPDGAPFVLVALALALGLVTAGLLSSTLHLGHPERAWRALSQWRSSWLSREGVAALLTYLPAGLFAIGALALGFANVVTVLMGVLAASGAIATVYCTSMIYASLKAVPAWASPLTIAGYLAFSGFTGAVLGHALLRLWTHEAAALMGAASMVLALAGFAVKLAQWARIDAGASPSTAGTATGLGRFGKVRLLEAPHSSPNYLMKEMGFEIARKHAGALRRAVVILAFFGPVALAIMALFVGGAGATVFAVLAVVSAGGGVAAERWLFFAEARHVVMLFYGGGPAPAAVDPKGLVG
jgi:DMSO reductase anchor subunit